MSHKIRNQISTGPMEEDWLIAELLYGDEHLGDIVEWGEKIYLYPRDTGEPWYFSVDELINAIQLARSQVCRDAMKKNNRNEYK